ncbi:MAG: rhomboid family intrarane serine protease [Chitinophagaceae bacterium]|jgi:membrane associated rhomboid family serine protease|nr:rhomboid family intrarane serine protease [Chitinophagaceae bacterium]
MGERDYFRKDFLKEQKPFQLDNAVTSLIIFHLIVFTTLLGLYLIYVVIHDTSATARPLFDAEVGGALNLPADASVFIRRPWTLLTYMFAHFSFWQMLSNMLWLWAFGYIFQTVAGEDKAWPVFIYSGFAGAVFFLLSSSFVTGDLSPELSGAGAAIMGLAIATTALAPGYRIFPMLLGNGIPLWVLTAVFVLIDLAVATKTANMRLAHIGGGGMGYLFVVMLRQGTDLGAWMNQFAHWVMNLFNPNKGAVPEKHRLHYKAKKEPFVKKPNLTQQKLDDILDKINQHGYEKLTEEEKDFLKKASERL